MDVEKGEVSLTSEMVTQVALVEVTWNDPYLSHYISSTIIIIEKNKSGASISK